MRVTVTAAAIIPLLLSGCANGANTSPATSNSAIASTAASTLPTTTTSLPSRTITSSVTATPPAAPKGPRPANGQIITRRGTGGRGTLRVENGTAQDALVTLAQGGQAVREIYIWAGRGGSISGISDGTYDLFYTSGTGWNQTLRAFTDDATYFKFDSPVEFKTRTTKNGIEYTRYKATLHAVPEGEVTKTPVTMGAYPR